MSRCQVQGNSEKSNEDRIFELECQVSMLTDFVEQLVGELKKAGLPVSDHLINVIEEGL